MNRIERIREEIEELMQRLEDNLRQAGEEKDRTAAATLGAGDRSETQGEEFIAPEAPNTRQTQSAPK